MIHTTIDNKMFCAYVLKGRISLQKMRLYTAIRTLHFVIGLTGALSSFNFSMYITEAVYV